MSWLDNHSTWAAEALIIIVLLKVISWVWVSFFGNTNTDNK